MTNVDKIVRKWEKRRKRTIAEQVKIQRGTEINILWTVIAILAWTEFIVLYFSGVKS